jgi:hypothetical protein
VAEREKSILRRRHFLGVLASGGVGLVAVEARAAGPPSGAETRETREDKSKARYRVTDDIRAFYRVNRYPARRS